MKKIIILNPKQVTITETDIMIIFDEGVIGMTANKPVFTSIIQQAEKALIETKTQTIKVDEEKQNAQTKKVVN